MIPPKLMGSFVINASERLSAPPFKGGLPGARPPLYVQQFVAGRLEGFLTKMSLHGRFRAAENEWARRLGYPIMRLPYVPLSGLVVRANPYSVLEVYETTLTFTSPEGAEAWLADALDGLQRVGGLPHLGDETLAYRLAFGSGANYELDVTVLFRVGDVATKLGVQGGMKMPAAAAANLARVAYKRLSDVCGNDESKGSAQ